MCAKGLVGINDVTPRLICTGEPSAALPGRGKSNWPSHRGAAAAQLRGQQGDEKELLALQPLRKALQEACRMFKWPRHDSLLYRGGIN